MWIQNFLNKFFSIKLPCTLYRIVEEGMT